MVKESYAHQHLVLESKRYILEIMKTAARMSLLASKDQKAEYTRLLKEIKAEYDKL